MDSVVVLIELYLSQNAGRGTEQIGKTVSLAAKEVVLSVQKLLECAPRTHPARTEYRAGRAASGRPTTAAVHVLA
jgi:hypothetical protein